MLGKEIIDVNGIEANEPKYPGLNILPMKTIYQNRKKTVQTKVRPIASFMKTDSNGPFFEGYEIHMGEIIRESTDHPLLTTESGEIEGHVLGQSVIGTIVHGLFNHSPIILNLLSHFLGHSRNWNHYDMLDRLANSLNEHTSPTFKDTVFFEPMQRIKHV